jgi:ubiquinone/menaquinone biosynthesis C-methylase UbiE
MNSIDPNLPPRPASSEEAAFVAIAPFYDELMNGVPYDTWITYLHRLLETRQANPKRVLDLACGTGNVTERLAQEGFEVTGVDIAPGMIEAARKKAAKQNLTIAYHVQDAAELHLPGETFDLCVSFFDSLNYITEPARLQAAMHRVAAHLVPDGLFIFDLNTDFALRNNFFDQDNLETNERLHYEWKSQYYPDSRLCRVQMQFWYREEDGSARAFEEVHWQYAYEEAEIKSMLTEAGFVDITSYQSYTLRATTQISDRVHYVARFSGETE